MHRDDDNDRDAWATAAVHAALNADNLAVRKHFLALVACYSQDEVSAKFGQELAESGQIIFVERDGERRYLRFQFDDTDLLPTVEAALRRLSPEMSRWQVAFWFVASNSWLNGRAPCEVLSDLDKLLISAEQESGGLGQGRHPACLRNGAVPIGVVAHADSQLIRSEVRNRISPLPIEAKYN
jgi:hypothetical protein